MQISSDRCTRKGLYKKAHPEKDMPIDKKDLLHCKYMDVLFLGLGNPPMYRGTRHNLGKDLVEGLVYEKKCQWRKVENGRIGCVLLGPHIITCMVSDGYMNETGRDMSGVLAEIDPSRLVVVHDEVDLSVGTIRLSRNKSPGGHRGVVSVAEVLGTNDFYRLRIGVGKEKGLERYVLEPVPPEDMETIVFALQESLPDIVLNKLLIDIPQVSV